MKSERLMLVGAPALLGLIGVLGAVGTAPEAQQAPALFSDASERIARDQATVPQPGPGDVRYLRNRLARLDLDLLETIRPGDELRFNLFDDVEFLIIATDVHSHRRGELSFHGHVAGMPL